MIPSEVAVAHIEATIPSGGAITDAIKLEPGVFPVGIYHPVITTSTAFTFSVCDTEDGTYVPFNSGGTAKSVSIDNSAASYEPLDPSDWAGVRYFKVKTADNQAADRVLKIAVRSY